MIQLWTLGRLDLRGSDRSELHSILTQPKRLALLAYLALHTPRGFVRRDRVLALFWPEQDLEHARGALNRALYHLRRSLGDAVLLSRGSDEIGLCWDRFWCDAAAFETAVAEARNRDAVELYQGELLDGLYVADAPGFEEWLEAERARYQNVAPRCGWAVAEAEELAGHASAAVQYARWSVERAPYDETGVQRLIALLDRTGDRAGAVLAYESFARQLADELQLAPAPETDALVDSIRRRQVVVAHVNPENGAITPAGGTTQGEELEQRERAAADVRTVVQANTPAPIALASVPSRRRLRRRLRVVVPVLGTVAVLGIAAVLAGRPRSSAFDARLILITPIENRTGDAAFDATARAATDWIARSVADAVESANQLTYVPRGRVIRRHEAASTGARDAREDSAATRISGELYRAGDGLRFHARAVDARRAGLAWPIPPIAASGDSAESAIRELGQRATGAVVALLHPRLASWFPVATAPPTYDALLEFLRAVHAQRWSEEGPYYERAAALDTTFTLALIKAARSQLGPNPVKSHAIVASLERRRERLPRLQLLMLNSIAATQAGNRTAVYEALAGAAALAPSEFRYAHAMSARALHRPRETLRLLDIIDQEQRQRGLPANWIVRTILHHELGEHRREAALALRARALYPNRLDNLYACVRALAAEGRIPEVTALLDTALSAPRDPDYTPGGIMLMAAEELRAHGYVAASIPIVQRSIAWYRSTPATEAHPWVHENNLAGALYLAGQWNEARPLFLKLAEEQRAFRAFFYGRLGGIAAHTGDHSLALRYLAMLDSIDIADGPAYEAFLSRARIATLLGDPESALRFLREGVGGQGMDLHADLDFASLEKIAAFREFIRPKG